MTRRLSFPRTPVVGAVLWTGYLGGAIATHVRVNDPLFTHVLFPVYRGAPPGWPLAAQWAASRCAPDPPDQLIERSMR